MKRRADQLLEGLTEEELDRLADEIAASGRDSLVSLLAAKRRDLEGDESTGKEVLFREVFGRDWSRKEDYLLRNEERLLAERIYEMVAAHQNRVDRLENTGRHDLMLLRGLLARGLTRAFASLARKLYNEAIERKEYRTARQINEIRLDYMLRFREVTPEGMEETGELLLENLHHVKAVFRQGVAENQHRRVVVVENLKAMGREVEPIAIGEDLDFTDVDDLLARYQDHLSRAHAAVPSEKPHHAKAALDLIEPVAAARAPVAMYAHAIYASTLYLNERYEEACDAFEAGIAFAEETKIEASPEMVFNYAGALMRLRRYTDVLDLLDRYRKAFEDRPKLSFRSECLRCFCHIHLGQPDEVYNAVPTDLKQRPESEHNYFRFILVILPYLRDDPESALREARNLTVYFSRNRSGLQFPHEETMARLYQRFYKTIYNEPDRDARRPSLERLRTDLDRFAEEYPTYRDYMYVGWLRDRIGEGA